MNNIPRPVLIGLAVGVPLVIIAIILAFVFGGGDNQPADTTPTDDVVIENGATASGRLVIEAEPAATQPTKETVTTLTTEQQSEVSLEKLARTFVERFGTYSSSNNFNNIRDIQPLMTTTMRNWSNTFISQQAKRDDDQVVTTRALAVDSVTVSGSTAEAVVSTRREEVVNGQATIYRQSMRVEFIQQGNQWLIDGAYWL